MRPGQFDDSGLEVGGEPLRCFVSPVAASGDIAVVGARCDRAGHSYRCELAGYPPREDGIATYTRDLMEAICTRSSRVTAQIAAITDPDAFYAYPRQVHWEIEQGNPDSYAEIGRTLSQAGVDVISLQHEFGLYGIWGDPLEDHTPALLDALRKPLVTTLHTVLPQPRPDIRAAVRELCARTAPV